VGNWVECRLDAGLFHAGKNGVVVTAESLDPLKTVIGWVLFRQIRLLPGG
ncbi:MAG: hypothetical protein HY303_13425, partial [Candidatus Wallbacteria bacterium]|nr:hypothetical protein [Candidatus Wallbacteria bacterium]